MFPLDITSIQVFDFHPRLPFQDRHTHVYACVCSQLLCLHRTIGGARSSRPRKPLAAPPYAAMPQLSSAEQNMIDDVTRRQKRSGADACRAVNTLRVRKQLDAVSVTAVHNYINGATHARGRADRRGHGQRLLTTVHVRKLAAARRRLIKKVDGARRVTYADVIAEAKLDVSCCQRTVMDAMRDEGIAYRPARAKVQITEEDAKKRLEFAEEWRVKPPSFWTNSVHGFLDCKAWPAPLTPKQRRKYNQTRVVGHLRYPWEGADRGFTKPRQKHAWIGVPAINIAAVVSGDRIVMFEAVESPWNGEAARKMYQDLVAPALKKRFPNKRMLASCALVTRRCTARWLRCARLITPRAWVAARTRSHIGVVAHVYAHRTHMGVRGRESPRMRGNLPSSRTGTGRVSSPIRARPQRLKWASHRSRCRRGARP